MQTYALKFVVIGDSGVGKSQLARRFTKKTFKDDMQSTVGMEFSTREIVFEKCSIKAQIWDTAGQDRFENMTKAYYRDAVGALLVFDVTNASSFENLKKLWFPQASYYGHEKMTFVLVGNKSDCTASQRRVSQYDAAKFAEDKHMDFIETSALTGENVERAFRRLVLSVAKLLPDVKIHLELVGLPEGWLMNTKTVRRSSSQDAPSMTTAATAMSSSMSIQGDKSPRNKSPTTFQKSNNRIIDISSHSPVSGSRGKLPTTPLSPHPTTSDAIHVLINSPSEMSLLSLQLSPTNTPSGPGPEMITVYTNYWTGEDTLESPTSPAPSGLFYDTKTGILDNRFSEFDQPIVRNTNVNPDYAESLMGNGSILSADPNDAQDYTVLKQTGNVIVSKYDAITTKSPRATTAMKSVKEQRDPGLLGKCHCSVS